MYHVSISPVTCVCSSCGEGILSGVRTPVWSTAACIPDAIYYTLYHYDMYYVSVSPVTCVRSSCGEGILSGVHTPEWCTTACIPDAIHYTLYRCCPYVLPVTTDNRDPSPQCGDDTCHPGTTSTNCWQFSYTGFDRPDDLEIEVPLVTNYSKFQRHSSSRRTTSVKHFNCIIELAKPEFPMLRKLNWFPSCKASKSGSKTSSR